MRSMDLNYGFPQNDTINRLLDTREYQAINAQLKSIIREACSDPPSGANRALIEKRITMLQCAIEEVERRIREKKLVAEMTKTREVLRHQLRRAQQDEERMQTIIKDSEERQKNIHELKEEKKYYYTQKNEQINAKITMLKENSINAQAEILERVEAVSEKRDRALARLKEEREKAVQEHKEKSQQRMEHCREVAQRRKQQQEAARKEKALAFMRHEEELAKRQVKFEDSPRRDYNNNNISHHHHHHHHSSRRRTGRERSISPTEGGEFLSQQRRRDHETLLKSLKEKEQLHQERYEAEQAMRMYEIQQRAALRKMRQERQQKNYANELERRIQRSDEIIEMARKKKRRGEKAKEYREAKELQAADAIARDVEEHRKRAEAHEVKRREETLRKKYYRWNERAARVIEQLNVALKADQGSHIIEEKSSGFLPELSAFRTRD